MKFSAFKLVHIFRLRQWTCTTQTVYKQAQQWTLPKVRSLLLPRPGENVEDGLADSLIEAVRYVRLASPQFGASLRDSHTSRWYDKQKFNYYQSNRKRTTRPIWCVCVCMSVMWAFVRARTFWLRCSHSLTPFFLTSFIDIILITSRDHWPQ